MDSKRTTMWASSVHWCEVCRRWPRATQTQGGVKREQLLRREVGWHSPGEGKAGTARRRPSLESVLTTTGIALPAPALVSVASARRDMFDAAQKAKTTQPDRIPAERQSCRHRVESTAQDHTARLHQMVRRQRGGGGGGSDGGGIGVGQLASKSAQVEAVRIHSKGGLPRRAKRTQLTIAMRCAWLQW